MNTFEGEEAGEHLSIGVNHTNYASRKDGLYMSMRGDAGRDYAYIGLSIDDIPDMIAALQVVYDEFEAHKAKNVGEVLADYPNGTIIKFDRDYNATYVKIDGKWFDPRYGGAGHTFRDGWLVENWPFTVKYNPEEAK